MGGKGQDMGGRFKRERIYVYLWLIHAEVWQKTTKFCKQLSFKKNFKKLKFYLTFEATSYYLSSMETFLILLSSSFAPYNIIYLLENHFINSKGGWKE